MFVKNVEERRNIEARASKSSTLICAPQCPASSPSLVANHNLLFQDEQSTLPESSHIRQHAVRNIRYLSIHLRTLESSNHAFTASQELQAAFKTLVSSEDQRGLICTIEKEALTPLTVLRPATSSFADDLSLLTPHLDPKVALYIILRRYASSESAPFVAITYVPDSAPVRQKMLFASTRLTLVRELGIERFRETIFATTKEELTPQGFEKHDKHVKLDAPLTEEEQTLGDVKRKEAEEGRGMNERKSHVSSGVSMPVTDDALRVLKGLAADGGDNLVQLVSSLYLQNLCQPC